MLGAAGGGQGGVLATDLDGTFIPLEGNERNAADLQRLGQELKRKHGILVFVTGRHFESVLQAIQHHSLPFPDWIICDVGSSIYTRHGGGYQLVQEYHAHQDDIIANLPIHQLQERMVAIEGLRLQEPEKQGRFKLSFYADAVQLSDLADRVRQALNEVEAPYSIIHSVDPFNGDGLIDLLPLDVSKAYALKWWAEHAGLRNEDIVFSGDSGNDYAALTAGYRAILVGNADRHLARRVFDEHRSQGWRDRLFLARGHATSGVLEGLEWYGLANPAVTPQETRIMPIGANCVSHNATSFRVWAPHLETIEVEILSDQASTRHRLQPEDNGYFSTTLSKVGPGCRYYYVLDDSKRRPDPVSRFQPEGVHGPSMVINPRRFPWTDAEWPGVSKRDLVIYELHLGAFTKEGTYRAAIERLPELADMGFTAIEIMPIAQSPGRWNWGYDGVNLFAPRNTYGEPDDFRALVDACHAQGLAVILDVVYNHVGPEGNYLAEFADYFSADKHTPWGEAFNFDGQWSSEVRRYVVSNVVYWMEEFHLDGLRLDAVHCMEDDSDPHILDEIGRAFSAYKQSVDRQVHLIAESNIYDHHLLTPQEHRPAYDGIWCDCLMHSVYSHALPQLQISHRSYSGAADLAEALEHGYLYHANDNLPHRSTPETRGSFQPTDRSAFITALQTHDVVGNHPQGLRLHQLTSKAYQQAAATLFMLYPTIPLVFMGEEAAVDAPFPFFADFEDPHLRQALEAGRAKEYPQHAWGTTPPPGEEQTFLAAKVYDPKLRDSSMIEWYRQLITVRKLGLKEGWLSTRGMSTGYQPEAHLFTIHYTRKSEPKVTIQVRLVPPDNGQSASSNGTVRLPLEGRILLSSTKISPSDNGQITLGINQAVVMRNPA